MRFLFRLKGSDVFITAEDPKVRYDVLCGPCGYPLAASDDQCPRCQRHLEDCPVCGDLHHRKSLRAKAAVGEAKTCTVCGVRRVPFGEEVSLRIQGSFCTNLYGCQAGGLLLRTEELAVLPAGAMLCPICRDPAFPPRDIVTFRHIIQRCLFCNACLGQIPAWPMDAPPGKTDPLEMRDLVPPLEPNREPCILCGRQDVLAGRAQDGDLVQVGHEEVLVPQYLRMAQLGRALVLEKGEAEAFSLTFKAWFDRLPPSAPEDPVAVQRLVTLLLLGTLREEVHAILKRRLEVFCAKWARTIPEGLEYRFRSRPAPSEPATARHF